MRFAVVLLLLAGWTSQPMIQRGEAPALELEAALAAARTYAAQHHIALDRRYLQGAVFDLASRRWVLDWQAPGTPLHLTVISVAESGAIEASAD